MTKLSEGDRLNLGVHRSLSLTMNALEAAGFTRTSPGRYNLGTLRVHLQYGCGMGAFKLFTSKSADQPAWSYEGADPLRYLWEGLGSGSVVYRKAHMRMREWDQLAKLQNIARRTWDETTLVESLDRTRRHHVE